MLMFSLMSSGSEGEAQAGQEVVQQMPDLVADKGKQDFEIHWLCNKSGKSGHILKGFLEIAPMLPE